MESSVTCNKFEMDLILSLNEHPLEGDPYGEVLTPPQDQIRDLVVLRSMGSAI